MSSSAQYVGCALKKFAIAKQVILLLLLTLVLSFWYPQVLPTRCLIGTCEHGPYYCKYSYSQ